MYKEELTLDKAAGKFMLYNWREDREVGYRAWLQVGWWTWNERNGIFLLVPSVF